MTNILKKENRIVLIVAIICLIFIGVIINYTYSFFAVEKTNSSIIAGEAESMNLTLTVTEKSSTNNGKLIPQLDEYITSAVKGRNGSCIDDNNNTVCQVYKITLTNAGSSTQSVNGDVVLDSKNNPNLKWAILNNTDTDVLTAPVLSGNIKTPDDTVLTTNELYTAGQTKNYFIVVWISETGLMQKDLGKFTGVVNFDNLQLMETTLTYSGTAPFHESATFNKTTTIEGLNKVRSVSTNNGSVTYSSDGTTLNYTLTGGNHSTVATNKLVTGVSSEPICSSGWEYSCNEQYFKEQLLEYDRSGATCGRRHRDYRCDNNYFGYSAKPPYYYNKGNDTMGRCEFEEVVVGRIVNRYREEITTGKYRYYVDAEWEASDGRIISDTLSSTSTYPDPTNSTKTFRYTTTYDGSGRGGEYNTVIFQCSNGDWSDGDYCYELKDAAKECGAPHCNVGDLYNSSCYTCPNGTYESKGQCRITEEYNYDYTITVVYYKQ